MNKQEMQEKKAEQAEQLFLEYEEVAKQEKRRRRAQQVKHYDAKMRDFFKEREREIRKRLNNNILVPSQNNCAFPNNKDKGDDTPCRMSCKRIDDHRIAECTLCGQLYEIVNNSFDMPKYRPVRLRS